MRWIILYIEKLLIKQSLRSCIIATYIHNYCFLFQPRLNHPFFTIFNILTFFYFNNEIIKFVNDKILNLNLKMRAPSYVIDQTKLCVFGKEYNPQNIFHKQCYSYSIFRVFIPSFISLIKEDLGITLHNDPNSIKYELPIVDEASIKFMQLVDVTNTQNAKNEQIKEISALELEIYIKDDNNLANIISYFTKDIDGSFNFIKKNINPYGSFIDMDFFIYFILISQIKNYSGTKLIKLLSLLPGTLDNPSDFFKYSKVIPKVKNSSLTEILFYENSNKEISINEKEFLKLQSHINTLFESYDFNHLTRLLTNRHGSIILYTLIIDSFINNNSIKLSLESSFFDLVKYFCKDKKIKHSQLVRLNSLNNEHFKFKLLRTPFDYNEASKLFKNCIFSYIDKTDEDIIIVFNIKEKYQPTACVSIKDGTIYQILGIHNEEVPENLRQLIKPIIISILQSEENISNPLIS